MAESTAGKKANMRDDSININKSSSVHNSDDRTM